MEARCLEAEQKGKKTSEDLVEVSHSLKDLKIANDDLEILHGC